MHPPRETLDWLYRVLTPVYTDANRTYSDTVQALTEHPTLKVRTDVYTDERGQSDLLLCISGTIPTVFANSTYRIPVAIWVPKSFPDVGPIGFVKPTESMLIHPGNHVDTNGRCYHPYLSYWNTSQSILGFIQILCEVFSKEPPVYAKPPAYRPPPVEARGLQSEASQPQQQPPLPPKPPKPNPQHQSEPHSQSNTPTPIHPSTQGAIPLAPQDPQHSSSPAPDIMDSTDAQLSNANGTPPARPPNPEKMNALAGLEQNLNSIKQELALEYETDDRALDHTEQTLAWMDAQLERETADLKRLNAACNENEQILIDKIEQAKRVIADANTRPAPDIDSIVCAENAVFNQLYDLVAEDHAIEDTIYMLGKIHDRDRIQLEPFMRHTRSLAREQFLKRALINKITGTIGLPSV